MKMISIAFLGITLVLLASAVVQSSPPVVKTYASAQTAQRKGPKHQPQAKTPRNNKKPPSLNARSASKVVRIKLPANLDLKHLGTVSVSASAMYLETLAEVLPFVDAIVVGKPLVAFPQRDHYATYSYINATESLVDYARSVGTFHIDQVLYQNADHGMTGLSSGQTINVGESVAIVPNGDEFIRFRLESCSELKQNSQYVVFLRKRNPDTYSPQYTSMFAALNLELGRFNTDGTDLDDEVGGSMERSLA